MQQALLSADADRSDEPAPAAASPAPVAPLSAYHPPAPRNIVPKSLLVVRSHSPVEANSPQSSTYGPITASVPNGPMAIGAGSMDLPPAGRHARATPPMRTARIASQTTPHVLLATNGTSSSVTARYELPVSAPPGSLPGLGRGFQAGRSVHSAVTSPSLTPSLHPSASGVDRSRSGSSESFRLLRPGRSGGASDADLFIPPPLMPSASGPNGSANGGPALALPPSVALASISALHVPSVRDELRSIWKLSWPVALAIFFRIAMLVTDLAMLGHCDTDWLAGASAASIWMSITSAFLYRAFGSALNTLCAQAFGAGNFKLMGLWLQQALFFSTIATAMVGVTWWWADTFLRWMLIEDDIAALAGTFARWSLLWLPAQVWMEMLQRYFQSQQIILPALLLNAIFVVVNALLNLLLLRGFPAGWWPSSWSHQVHEHGWDGLGFQGSPIATAISRWGMLALYWFYCFPWRRLHGTTFPNGWKWRLTRQQALHPARVRQYLLTQVLPTSLGICLEEWQLALVALFATKLGSVQIATHNVVLELFFFATSLMFGLVAATQIRISTYLGGGNALAARQVAHLALRVSLGIGMLIGSLFVILRHEVGKIFSSDPEILHQSSRIAVLVGVCYAALSVFYTAMAVLSGQARPLLVAVAYLIGCWVVAIPLSYVLAFTAGLELMGLWYGLAAGYGVVTLIVGWKAYTSDWHACVLAALLRAEAKKNAGPEAADAALAANATTEGGKGEGGKKRRRKKRAQQPLRRDSSLELGGGGSSVPLSPRSTACGSLDAINSGANGPSLSTALLSDARGAGLAASSEHAIGVDDGFDEEGEEGSDFDYSSSSSEEEAWNAEEMRWKEEQLKKQRAAAVAAAQQQEQANATASA